MVTLPPLDEFLARVIAGRGFQFDPSGIDHTHTKGTAGAVLPTFKFHLCTSKIRREGLLLEHEVDIIAGFIADGILKTHPRPRAIAGVPNAGTDLAARVEACLAVMGIPVVRLVLFKHASGTFTVHDHPRYQAGAVCLIDDVCHWGISKKRAINALAQKGFWVDSIRVFLGYEQGGEQEIKKLGATVHAVAGVRRTLLLGRERGPIPSGNYQASIDYLEGTRQAA